MKINPLNNPNILKSYTKRPAAPAAGRAQPQGLDEVAFSPEGLSFARALAEAQKAPAPAAADPARQARLEDLSRQIAAGEYQVSGRDVADKMVDDILSRLQG